VKVFPATVWLLGLAGLLQGAALALPDWAVWPGAAAGEAVGFWQWLGMTLLAWVLLRNGGARASGARATVFRMTWWFSTAWLMAVMWWLFISMHRYGGLPAPVAALAVGGLCAGFGAIYAGMMVLCTRFAEAGAKVWAWPLCFASLWTQAELVRAQLLTGLPWGAVGYAHVDSPLATLAPWVGVYGVGWLAALLAAFSAQAIFLKSKAAICWFATLLFGVALSCALATRLSDQSHRSSSMEQGVEVALLQGNIPQDEKFTRGKGVELALDWYAQQIAKTNVKLILAPETAVPLLPQELDPGYWQQWASSPTLKQGGAVMTGVPLGNPRDGYSNSVIAVVAQAEGASTRVAYQYDKHHLVPFGEFIPPFFRWFTDRMHIPLGDFNRGGLMQPSWRFLGLNWAPNICFEDLFGEELAKRFVTEGDAPDVLVNFSNLGWFGDSSAIAQHLNISRMRSKELARPMVRVTNTGASAVINDRGEVTAAVPPHQRVVAKVWVPVRHAETTPYSQWVGAWGLWPVWGICLLGLLVCGLFGLPGGWFRIVTPEN
jgi:apolipoprotein N-acyltransferase